jgi:hypothetical protein
MEFVGGLDDDGLLVSASEVGTALSNSIFCPSAIIQPIFLDKIT